MLDTETANTLVEEDGKIDTRFALPYDIGFAVIDSYGRIYETHSYVIRDIFTYEKELMQSAYYAEKIPRYEKDIQEGKRILASAYDVRQIILNLINKYNIKFVCAHNARFDHKSMNNLIRWTTKSKYRYFFPKDIEYWDTLKMATDVVSKTPTYIKFCTTNGYMTKHKNPRPQLTAEVLYRYITNNTEFEESHTGLEDVLIEAKILNFCRRKHKKMRKKLF